MRYAFPVARSVALTLATSLGACGAPSTPADPAPVVSTYNRVSDFTSVETHAVLRPADGASLGMLFAGVTFDGDQREGTPTSREVIVLVNAVRPSWPRGSAIQFLINDTLRVSAVGEASSRSSVITFMPLADFLRLARAARLDGRVGLYAFRVPPVGLTSLRALARRIEEPTAR